MTPIPKPTCIIIRKSLFHTRRIRISPSFAGNPSLIHICRDIDSRFSSPDRKPLKDDRSSTVLKDVLAPDMTVVVRRDNGVSFFKRIKRMLQSSRSRKVWKKGRMLETFGFNTIDPIALIEDYRGPFRIASYVICKYIDGTTLKAYLSDPAVSSTQKKRIADGVVHGIRQWHALGITHGDPKAANLLIAGHDVYFIDIEDVSVPQCRWSRVAGMIRDRYILLHNWQKYPALRHPWIRTFTLDRDVPVRHFGKKLVKKFWKEEHAILFARHPGNIHVDAYVDTILPKRPLMRLLNLVKCRAKTVSLQRGPVLHGFISQRAFFFQRSTNAYFKKRRVPRKGVFSMFVAMGICGFNLPEIVAGGISSGCEYVFFGEHGGESVLHAWQTARDDAVMKRIFLETMAEEIGRLHALGFTGVIQSIDSVFAKMAHGAFTVGFLPGCGVSYCSRLKDRSAAKELRIIDAQFLSDLCAEDSAIFKDVYRMIVE